MVQSVLSEAKRAACQHFRCAVSISIFAISILLSPTVASATTPQYGTGVSRKFEVIYAAPEATHDCDALAGSLNIPMLFDPNDRARSYLAADSALLWLQQSGADDWQPPRTLGSIYEHSSLERLDIDIDGNGSTETILRRWYEIKGQKFNRVFLDPNPTHASTPTPETVLLDEGHLRKLVDGLRDIQIDSSFYLFEVLNQGDQVYLVALSTVFGGDQMSDRPAYIVKYSPRMIASLVCVLNTIIH